MEINPDRVIFHPPLEQINSTRITLKNSGSSLLMYKIKTTAPQVYCVKPNSATIPAGHSLEVTITRQGGDADFTKPCKDKFLVLSAPVDESLAQEHKPTHELWTEVEALNKKNGKSLSSRKLLVQYGETTAGAAKSSTGKDTHDHVSPQHHLGDERSANSADISASSLPDSVEIPPKSREIDMGDAKTGPHLDNSNLPNGPPAEHAEDYEKELEKRHAKVQQHGEALVYPKKIDETLVTEAAVAAVEAIDKEREEVNGALTSSAGKMTFNEPHHQSDNHHGSDKDKETTKSATTAPSATTATTASSESQSVRPESVQSATAQFASSEPVPAAAAPASATSASASASASQPAPIPQQPVRPVGVENAVLDGQKGKMSFHKSPESENTTSGKGKLTVEEHAAEEKRVADLLRPKNDFTEPAAAQMVPLNVAAIIAFIAFFIGWKFF